jgi:ubiquinone/menaquinone biosynthesis C-methylase UbiE
MTTPGEPPTGRNVYFNDPESGAEMARLIDQDRLITQGMGGPLPEHSNDFAGLHRILDIGCGPGGWLLDIAFEHPEIEVVGIDISQAMTDYARGRAHVQGLHNASFHAMDMLQPLQFPENSFDLVNSRFVGWIPTKAWPIFLRECLRITRPGGTIRLIDSEWTGLSTSLALEQHLGMLVHALKKAGQSFSPSGNLYGMTPMLRSLLREAGCIDIHHLAHAIDYSFGEEVHQALYKDFALAYRLAQPFLLNSGVATQEELDRLQQQFEWDMRQEDFRGMMFLLTAWGHKPRESNGAGHEHTS